jgi:hypothetical protein
MYSKKQNAVYVGKAMGDITWWPFKCSGHCKEGLWLVRLRMRLSYYTPYAHETYHDDERGDDYRAVRQMGQLAASSHQQDRVWDLVNKPARFLFLSRLTRKDQQPAGFQLEDMGQAFQILVDQYV